MNRTWGTALSERCHGHRRRGVLARRAFPNRPPAPARSARTAALNRAIGYSRLPVSARDREVGVMIGLLILAGAVGLVAATAALWAQGRTMIHQRIFAGLISLAGTVTLLSLIAWAAVAVMTTAPLLLTWGFVGTLALMFARRLYRELRTVPAVD